MPTPGVESIKFCLGGINQIEFPLDKTRSDGSFVTINTN